MISTSKGRFDNVSKKEGKAQVSIQSSTRPDTNGKVKTPHLDITNETQEVSPFPTGDYKASINRRARKHDKNKTEITYEMGKGNSALGYPQHRWGKRPLYFLLFIEQTRVIFVNFVTVYTQILFIV